VLDENARRIAVRSWINLGAVLSSGDAAGAALATEQAVALAPENHLARINAARYHLALGRDDAALAHARVAVRLGPRRAEAWALLGTLDARAGRCAEAIAHLERALALDAGDPDATVNLPRVQQACREAK
jgi:Flp pilus assembly protein TadD